MVSDRQVEDRAVVHQWVAVLRRSNGKPGLGGQILYRPKPWLSIVANNYGLGEDSGWHSRPFAPHTDDSVEIKYYDKPDNFIDKAAFTLPGILDASSAAV